jgi:hypothetical protein
MRQKSVHAESPSERIVKNIRRATRWTACAARGWFMEDRTVRQYYYIDLRTVIRYAVLP